MLAQNVSAASLDQAVVVGWQPTADVRSKAGFTFGPTAAIICDNVYFLGAVFSGSSSAATLVGYLAALCATMPSHSRDSPYDAA